jgi:uncharacterized membrane protein
MSGFSIWLYTTLLSFAPIAELRGGIPFAMAHGWPWWMAFLYCVVINALVAPVFWLFISSLHKVFLKNRHYHKWFHKFVEHAQKKLHKGIEKWGWLGIAAFVAIPLPITGAWTGTIGAWALGLDKKKTMLAIVIGVVISGTIVTTIMTLGLSGLDLFVKK